MGYLRPADLDEALTHLAKKRLTILAGGTDLYPATSAQVLPGDILDINDLASLRGITKTATDWRIGARTTWTDLQRSDLPAAFDALKQAAREIGSIQIQNSGTIAGNLCNASPAADGTPALMVLNASVEISALGRTRHVPLHDFVSGARATVLRDDELVTAITVPHASMHGRTAFAKFGARKYLVISIAVAAAYLVFEEKQIAEAAVAVGACSAKPVRMIEVERALIGKPWTSEAIEAVTDARVAAQLAPIDDARASAEYRIAAAAALVRRTIEGLLLQ